MATIIQSQATMALENRHTSGAYGKRPVVLVRGQGARVWDEDGREYIDAASGHGVALVGHSHPAVAQAVAEQSARLITCPESMYNDRRAALLAKLAALAPAHERIFLCNSGTEAMEGALKFARLATERTGFVATMRGFHGRTMGALSLTWEPKYRQPFEPLIPGVTHVAYDNLDALAEVVNEQTAAVVLEPVQGEGGVRLPSPGYLRAVRQLCDERGALLIMDEIQTGLGRTGAWFASQHAGIVPDIITLAKGLAGGLPVGAILLGAKIPPLQPMTHGSTYGGNPLVCAAALATLQVIEDEGLVRAAAEQGAYLLERLRGIESKQVREVRGSGLMVGIELRGRVTPYLMALMERSVIALPAGTTVLRLLPPLVITRAELDTVVDAIADALATTKAE